MRTILRCGNDRLRWHEWEIRTQTQFQLDLSGSGGYNRFKYTSVPIVDALFSNCPIVLALSKHPLLCHSVLSLNDIMQLLTTFSWDADMYSAEFILSNALMADVNALDLHVTLVGIGVMGLQVAASSAKLSDLQQCPVDRDTSALWRGSTNTPLKVSSEQLDQLEKLNPCATCKIVRVCSKCAKCLQTSYCSKECQILDWKRGHRKTCQASTATNK